MSEVLYKYLSPERIDVLESGMIRFTQPSCFNDPFESLPYVKQVCSDEVIEQIAALFSDEDTYNMFFSKEEEPYQNFNNARNNFLKDPESFKANLLGKHFDLNAGMQEFWSSIIGIGILSLSEDDDNLTMWSHYAKDHTGFLIGFNSEKKITSKIYRSPRRVRYLYKRPQIILIKDSFDPKQILDGWLDLIYTKSKEWSNENEWRQVHLLENASDIKNHDIYLFKYNRESVEEIILGCRMDPKVETQILKDVEGWNVKVFKMKLDEENYFLDKIRIN